MIGHFLKKAKRPLSSDYCFSSDVQHFKIAVSCEIVQSMAPIASP